MSGVRDRWMERVPGRLGGGGRIWTKMILSRRLENKSRTGAYTR